MLKLYSYYRSSASFRARIALHWKELPFEYVPIHLLKDQQNSAEYQRMNPMGHVPALVDGTFVLGETVAIYEYLEMKFPAHPLFPKAAADKARVLQLCEIVNSGIQPLQNLKVQKYMESHYKWSPEESKAFLLHWMGDGMSKLEKFIGTTAGAFAFGDGFTAADGFIVPQCATAARFGLRMEEYPLLARVQATALKVVAVQKSLPDRQPDFPG